MVAGRQQPRRWQFLTSHSHVLLHLATHPTASAREIGAAGGITERQARRILANLTHDGYLTKKRAGTRNTYTINRRRRLRHPQNQSLPIGTLIDTLQHHHRSPKPTSKKPRTSGR